jgi:hypothetical protein
VGAGVVQEGAGKASGKHAKRNIWATSSTILSVQVSYPLSDNAATGHIFLAKG